MPDEQTNRTTKALLSWTVVVPILAVVILGLAWGRTLSPPIVGVGTILLASSVLAAVHHAEVVAHRVGEPFGALDSVSR